MKPRTYPPALVAFVAILPTLVFAQVSTDDRQKAIDALLARGDKLAADGDSEQARSAWDLVLEYAPTNSAAKAKLAALPSTDLSPLSKEEQAIAIDVISNSHGENLCAFPPAAPAMETVNLRMLVDTRLLPGLKMATVVPLCDGRHASGVSLFLTKSALSAADVVSTYGQPQQEKDRIEGRGYRSLTYGRLRILATEDGRVAAVVFPPSTK